MESLSFTKFAQNKAPRVTDRVWSRYCLGLNKEEDENKSTYFNDSNERNTENKKLDINFWKSHFDKMSVVHCPKDALSINKKSTMSLLGIAEGDAFAFIGNTDLLVLDSTASKNNMDNVRAIIEIKEYALNNKDDIDYNTSTNTRTITTAITTLNAQTGGPPLKKMKATVELSETPQSSASSTSSTSSTSIIRYKPSSDIVQRKLLISLICCCGLARHNKTIIGIATNLNDHDHSLIMYYNMSLKRFMNEAVGSNKLKYIVQFINDSNDKKIGELLPNIGIPPFQSKYNLYLSMFIYI